MAVVLEGSGEAGKEVAIEVGVPELPFGATLRRSGDFNEDGGVSVGW